MKRDLYAKLTVLATALVLVLAGCGVSEAPAELESAGYQQDQDVYIVFKGQHIRSATLLFNLLLPSDLISDLLFELQEGTHETITDVSGAEIDHYYIWLCLEELCIPVDPFSYNY